MFANKKIQSLSLVLLTLLMVACGSKQAQSPAAVAAPANIIDGLWMLESGWCTKADTTTPGKQSLAFRKDVSGTTLDEAATLAQYYTAHDFSATTAYKFESTQGNLNPLGLIIDLFFTARKDQKVVILDLSRKKEILVKDADSNNIVPYKTKIIDDKFKGVSETLDSKVLRADTSIRLSTDALKTDIGWDFEAVKTLAITNDKHLIVTTNNAQLCADLVGDTTTNAANNYQHHLLFQAVEEDLQTTTNITDVANVPAKILNHLNK